MNVKDKIKRIFLLPKANIIRISGNIRDDIIFDFHDSLNIAYFRKGRNYIPYKFN